jgi:hypothetical protein
MFNKLASVCLTSMSYLSSTTKCDQKYKGDDYEFGDIKAGAKRELLFNKLGLAHILCLFVEKPPCLVAGFAVTKFMTIIAMNCVTLICHA